MKLTLPSTRLQCRCRLESARAWLVLKLAFLSCSGQLIPPPPSPLFPWVQRVLIFHSQPCVIMPVVAVFQPLTLRPAVETFTLVKAFPWCNRNLTPESLPQNHIVPSIVTPAQHLESPLNHSCSSIQNLPEFHLK